MFKCRECDGGVESVFSKASVYMAHLQFYHPGLKTGVSLKCAYNGCMREFDKFYSFRKHTLRHHDVGLEQVTCVPMELDNHSDVCDEELTSSSFKVNIDEVLPLQSKTESLKFDQTLSHSIVSFIAKLYESGLTETQVQNVIENIMEMLNGPFLPILKESILKLFSKSKEISETEQKNVSHMFDSIINMFDGFQTTHLRQAEFSACGAFVKPEEPFVTGHAVTEKYVGGEVVLEPISLTGQFIKFSNILKGFLEQPGVLTTVLNYILKLESEESGKIENLMQASLWKDKIKPLFGSKTVFPLTFYFDDYETNKELGSHAGVYSVGAGYIRLPFLPPRHQGVLKNIFLVLLFHSTDKAFGNKAIFQKVVDEFSFLESTGISVVTPDNVVHEIYFALCFVGGDNKGANEILGYVKGFSANYYCRICFQFRDVNQKKCCIDPMKLREPARYERELKINNASQTGRRDACIFNSLQSYHVYQNFHVDIMHDWDEGIWKYLMTNIVKYFVSKRRFTLVYLNELVQGFFYGPNELRNKPPLILERHLEKNKLLKFNASEMRCFVRYFGLMVGHLVTEDDEDVWQLYLTTRKIADIITAPAILPSDPGTLEKLLKKHHAEYRRLFKKKLTPKFHFGLHDPQVMKELGPLDPISCMRMEAKHKEGSDVARKSKNRINLPETIINRNQMNVAFRFLSGKGLDPNFSHGQVKNVRLHCIHDHELFIDSLPIPLTLEEWKVVKWVRTNGMTYEENVVVVLPHLGLPRFGLISVIKLGENQTIYFVVNVLNTLGFDNHVHAFEVVRTGDWEIVAMDSLYTHVVTALRVAMGKRYVSFRHSLSNCSSF